MTKLIVDLESSQRTIQIIFLAVNVCLTLDQQHDRGTSTESPRMKWIDGLIVRDNSPGESAKVCMTVQTIRPREVSW